MPYDFCTSKAIINKAGAGVSQTAATSSALLDQYYDDSQGYVNGITRYDWNANSGAVTTNFKLLLADAISNLAGAYLVSFDMSGYTTLGEAETLINVLYDRASKSLKVLADDKLKTTMGAPT